MTLELVTSLFGWMTLINSVIYLWTAALIVLGRRWMADLQSRILGVPPEDWPRLSMEFLGRYKLALLMFNVVPYVALLIVS